MLHRQMCARMYCHDVGVVTAAVQAPKLMTQGQISTEYIMSETVNEAFDYFYVLVSRANTRAASGILGFHFLWTAGSSLRWGKMLWCHQACNEIIFISLHPGHGHICRGTAVDAIQPDGDVR